MVLCLIGILVLTQISYALIVKYNDELIQLLVKNQNNIQTNKRFDINNVIYLCTLTDISFDYKELKCVDLRNVIK